MFHFAYCTEAEKQIENLKHRREGLKNSQPRSFRRHMWDDTQRSSQTLMFTRYETETSEIREATHRSGKLHASRIQIPLMEDVGQWQNNSSVEKNIHQS